MVKNKNRWVCTKYIKETKGDKLGFPSASTVLANAIGLGPTEPCRYPCNFAVVILLGQ
jgi:hypothetical protein